ncbi:helix-turn-helix domain-containing protein, partial [Chryseobacterium artocarpi]|uniref:helix-turn-helix domain-containing protein n=1 Tax=Chryseobacterium artocarpi TaxID=1414727 RepID=UPI003F414AD0
CSLLDIALFNKENELDTSVKVSKKPTHLITFQLFEEGNTAFDIAEKRNLSISTVYKHLSKMGVNDL